MIYSVQKHIGWLIIFLLVSPGFTSAAADDVKLDQVQLPAGFRIRLYVRNLPNARSLTLSPGGVVFVGTRKAGKVYAVVDQNRDGTADNTYIIADGLNMPNGVAYKNGSLYVAEVNRILRYDRVEQRLGQEMVPVVVNNSFPRDRHHGWKYMSEEFAIRWVLTGIPRHGNSGLPQFQHSNIPSFHVAVKR